MPMEPTSLSWAQGAPSPQSSDPDPPGSTGAVSLGAAVSLCPWLCQAGALGQRSCWALVPARARSCSLLCAPAGLRVGDSSVSPACPAELAQPVGRSQDRDVPAQGWGQDRDGVRTGMSLLRGVPAPAPRWPWWALPSHCCPQRQEVTPARLCRSSGAVQTPGPAEPILVPSGSQFLTPGLGDAAPPVPHSQLCSHPRQPGDPLGCPCVPVPAGTVLPLPRLWTDSSVPPSWGGKVCSCFCLFAMFIPIDLHP